MIGTTDGQTIEGFEIPQMSKEEIALLTAHHKDRLPEGFLPVVKGAELNETSFGPLFELDTKCPAPTPKLDELLTSTRIPNLGYINNKDLTYPR